MSLRWNKFWSPSLSLRMQRRCKNQAVSRSNGKLDPDTIKNNGRTSNTSHRRQKHGLWCERCTSLASSLTCQFLYTKTGLIKWFATFGQFTKWWEESTKFLFTNAYVLFLSLKWIRECGSRLLQKNESTSVRKTDIWHQAGVKRHPDKISEFLALFICLPYKRTLLINYA